MNHVRAIHESPSITDEVRAFLRLVAVIQRRLTELPDRDDRV